MTTIELNSDGSGMISILHDKAHWERIPFSNKDEMEILAYRNGIRLNDNVEMWHNAYKEVQCG